MTLAQPAGYRQPPPGTHPPLDYPGYKSTGLRRRATAT
jgi:protocatechuate 3,4-dioxygenase beta subunit